MTGSRFRELLGASELPRLEALALMQAASGRTREWLIAHELEMCDAPTQLLFERFAAKRRSGQPLAYLMGWREFYGRPFWVNRHTLIPRIDTELLVDTALGLLREMPEPSNKTLHVCDLGTGSGCIGISLALESNRAIHVTATDQSREAIQMARNNAAWLGASDRMTFFCGSWWDALATQKAAAATRFHGIVSNPPYVLEGDAHLCQGDLRFEPTSALCADQHGLADITAIAMGAAERLEPKGFLLIEHGFEQQDDVAAIFSRAGLVEIQGLRDLAGKPRAVLGFHRG